MTPDDFKAIDVAVNAVKHRLEPEARFDLRQELAIKLLERKEAIENVGGWLFEAACNWASNFLRSEKRNRELLSNAPRYRRGDVWEPKWFPPHASATEFAPFACKGARVMTVKST